MKFSKLAVLVVSACLVSSNLLASELNVRVEAGPAYRATGRFGPLKFAVTPQVAIWLEDGSGRYLETIYVTRCSAKGNWHGLTKVRRPEALPVWSHRRGVRAADGLFMPDAVNPLPDSVSGATPVATYTRSRHLSLKPGRYVVWLEVNNSFDFNGFYAKGLARSAPGYCAENGQPSLVYRAELLVGAQPVDACLVAYGSGHVLGLDGLVQHAQMRYLTSAKQILKQVWIEYRP